jgi:hypothetical protein
MTALSVPSFGAFVEYNDRAAFDAAVPGVVTFDFETSSGFPLAEAPLDSIGATIDLSTSGGDSTVTLSEYGNGFGQAIGGRTNDEVDNFAAVVVAFSAPYYAVGFDDLDLTHIGSPEFAIINVVLASGSFNFLRINPGGDLTQAPFFGIWADEAILGLRVWSGNNPNDLPGIRANLIDNLSVSRSALNSDVPEPTTWLLFGTGLALAAFRRRIS